MDRITRRRQSRRDARGSAIALPKLRSGELIKQTL